jgi:hypothetical protein
MTIDKALFSSESSEWETPQAFYDKISSIVGGFTLDAASTEQNKKTKDRLQDGLRDYWNSRVWCNPPYSIPEHPCKPNCKKKKCKKRGHHVDTYQAGTGDWVLKAIGSRASSCLLLPARTDAKWGQRALNYSSTTLFIAGRLKFETDGVALASSAPFPSMLCFYNWQLSKSQIADLAELGIVF